MKTDTTTDRDWKPHIARLDAQMGALANQLSAFIQTQAARDDALFKKMDDLSVKQSPNVATWGMWCAIVVTLCFSFWSVISHSIENTILAGDARVELKQSLQFDKNDQRISALEHFIDDQVRGDENELRDLRKRERLLPP